MAIERFTIVRHADMASLVASDLVPLDSGELENNWRGRILRFGTDFTIATEPERVRHVFLKSYFRLILSLVGGEYFARRDIIPLFYKQPDSNAGFPTYNGSVHSFVAFLNSGRGIGRGLADPEFDYLHVYTSDGPGEAYELLRAFDGNSEIPLSEVYDQINAIGLDQYAEALFNRIDAAWNAG